MISINSSKNLEKNDFCLPGNPNSRDPKAEIIDTHWSLRSMLNEDVSPIRVKIKSDRLILDMMKFWVKMCFFTSSAV